MATKKKIFKILDNVYYTIYAISQRFRQTIILLIHGRKYINNKRSCYPEADHKSNIMIALDQFIHLWKYGEINEFYYMYGMDVKGCVYANQLLDYVTFFRSRNKYNNLSELSYINVLRDKMLFGIYANALGINTPNNIGFLEKNNVYLFNSKNFVALEDFINNTRNLDCFIKAIDGECGKSVYLVKVENSKIWVDNKQVKQSDFKNIFKSNVRYLIQERLIQHEDLNRLYSLSVNTLRLVTLRRNDSVIVLPSVLRVGAGGAIIDNWSQGGIAIGVDLLNGSLKKQGVYRPEYSKIVTKHPDTNITFEGYKLPMFEQAVEMAKRFHNLIPNIDSIGWDIAFTNNGPCFIEGNDNWEVSLNQACNLDEVGVFKKYFSKV